MNSQLSILGLCVICITSSAKVFAEESTTSSAKRRTIIQLELDRNHDAIHRMYAELESIPATEPDHRRYVESQIEAFDARNNVLFDEMDGLDRKQLKRHRKDQLKAYADRLSTKATRTDTAKPSVEHREAKLLEDAIAGDQWEKFIDGTFSDKDAEKNSGPIYLFVENVRLRAEVETLKKEVEALRKQAAKLEALLKAERKPPVATR